MRSRDKLFEITLNEIFQHMHVSITVAEKATALPNTRKILSITPTTRVPLATTTRNAQPR